MTAVREASVTKNIREKSIAQRLASNFGWLVLSEAIGKGVFFITTIYLARILGVSNFGLFALAQTIAFYFWLAVDLGTNMYGIREIAKDKEHAEDLINPILTLRITAGFLVFSVYAITLFILEMPSLGKLVLLASGLYLLTYSFYTDWVFKGLEKFKYIALGSLVSSTVFFAGTLYFVRGGEAIIEASFIWAFSYFLSSLSMLYFLYRKAGIKFRPSFTLKIWFSHVRKSIFYTMSSAFMIIYQYLPILLIGFILSNYHIGLYSAAYRTTLVIYGLIQLFINSFYPVLSEMHSSDNNKFNSLHVKYVVTALPLFVLASLGGVLQGDTIIEFFFGPQYAQSSTLFKITIWLIPLYFLRSAYWISLSIRNEWRNYLLTCVVSCVLLSAAGVVLIQKLGVIGAAVALLFSELVAVTQLVITSKLRKTSC